MVTDHGQPWPTMVDHELPWSAMKYDVQPWYFIDIDHVLLNGTQWPCSETVSDYGHSWSITMVDMVNNHGAI